jgi:hypothetical protein
MFLNRNDTKIILKMRLKIVANSRLRKGPENDIIVEAFLN